MKSIIFLISFSLAAQYCYSQSRKQNNELWLSIPIIWTNTEIFNVFSGARAEQLSAIAISYGININYSKSFEAFYAIGGIGYFKQIFEINRPFEFNGDTITKLLYHTKLYSYGNINWLIGIGYKHEINKEYLLRGSVHLNGLYSIHQRYMPTGYSGSEHKKYK